MKKFFFAFLLAGSFSAAAQTLSKPKLVVGIVVDQMRWEYLYRFYDRYSAGGFKRMLNEGFSCENTFIPYLPTHTAPGHASIYTGSVPALHGIVGNYWYNPQTKEQSVYCVDDSTVQTVGSNSAEGQMSPKNMWATTVSDELRINSNFRSKVIAISLKDRGSILPGGHAANAAYWFDNASAGWISSTYYMNSLPKWMGQLNARKLPDEYLAKNWNTLYPIDTYVQSTADNKTYEGAMPGEDNSFPHRTDNLTKTKYDAFRVSPFGNTFTADAAKAAIEGEALGSRGATDLLAISFSSPDYIGHTFGPNSIEVEDCYLRLDRDLADLFTYLDTKIGKGEYLVFLTADHAVVNTKGYAAENKTQPVILAPVAVRKMLNDSLQAEFGGMNYIQNVSNYQVFLNEELIRQNKADREAIKKSILRTLRFHQGISQAVDLENISGLPQSLQKVLANSYNQKLSGVIQYLYKPGWFEGGERGTTHGSWNPYDSHIPLLWFGWNIKQGRSNREVYMTDIAPTLAAMLQIQMPNACVGKVITEVTPGY